MAYREGRQQPLFFCLWRLTVCTVEIADTIFETIPHELLIKVALIAAKVMNEIENLVRFGEERRRFIE
jgi:hypothetical protein